MFFETVVFIKQTYRYVANNLTPRKDEAAVSRAAEFRNVAQWQSSGDLPKNNESRIPVRIWAFRSRVESKCYLAQCQVALRFFSRLTKVHGHHNEKRRKRQAKKVRCAVGRP